MESPTLRITGYSDPLSVRPGETIRFFVHSESEEPYEAQIVRLIHGDTNPEGPGYKEAEIACEANGRYSGRAQPVFMGSYIFAPHEPRLSAESFTIAALIYPTTPDLGLQGIATKWSLPDETGFGLFVDEQGELSLRIGRGRGEVVRISSGKPLFRKVWYIAAATFDAKTGEARLYQEPYVTPTNCGHGMRLIEPVTDTLALATGELGAGAPAENDCPLALAAACERARSGRFIGGGHHHHLTEPLEIPEHGANFNGRIERPALASRALDRDGIERLLFGSASLPAELSSDVIARWDFSQSLGKDAASQQAIDTSLNGLHGHCVNLPDRGMPGHNWTGDHMSFVAAPGEYGAIHFHDDSVDDARWESDFELAVPETLKSGVYAARLRVGGDPSPQNEDYIPFVVRPPAGQATSKIALILPTASYLAYANENLSADSQVAQLLTGRAPLFQPGDLLLQEKGGYGLGTYTVHSDGWGVCTSSRLRPILNMRPKYNHVLSPSAWQLNADLYITDWLEAMGFEFDVHTDEDLQREGVALLSPYQVVLTGHHPEYNSEQMLDAYEAYQQRGGRWLYLGANGFYWVCAFHPDNPALIEVRKGDNGTRAWTVEPGEYCNAFDGKHGGLWRVRGRNMSKLVGVTFTSFGLGASSYYRRTPDSVLPECEWMFEGIGKDEPIGDFGLIGDGAAGLELDRYDLELGTPHNAYVVAHSEGHNDFYVTVTEESTFNARGYFAAGGLGDSNPYTRADIVYFKTPGDGAVFSVSSMAWAGSLSHNNYDNNVSRLTANVIRGFLEDGPLPCGAVMELEVLAWGYQLVEGPRTDSKNNLYFTDAFGSKVFRRSPDGDIQTLISGRPMVGGLALHEDGGFVMSGPTVAHWKDGATRTLLARDGVQSFNDIHPDRDGRILAGAIRSDLHDLKAEKVLGECVRIGTDGEVEDLYGGVEISNGIGFSPDGSVLYHVDSTSKGIIAHDVAPDDTLSGRRHIGRGSFARGIPDGMCVDTDGNLWVAHVGGRRVVKLSPSGDELDEIPVPAKAVTSCAFGGPEMSDLYIVTADNQAEASRGGTIFRCRPGVAGVPTPLARV